MAPNVNTVLYSQRVIHSSIIFKYVTLIVLHHLNLSKKYPEKHKATYGSVLDILQIPSDIGGNLVLSFIFTGILNCLTMCWCKKGPASEMVWASLFTPSMFFLRHVLIWYTAIFPYCRKVATTLRISLHFYVAVEMFSYNVLRQRCGNAHETFLEYVAATLVCQRFHNFPPTLWKRCCNHTLYIVSWEDTPQQHFSCHQHTNSDVVSTPQHQYSCHQHTSTPIIMSSAHLITNSHVVEEQFTSSASLLIRATCTCQ